MNVVAGVDLGGTASRIVIHGSEGSIASDAVATAELGDGESDARMTCLTDRIRALVPEGSRLAALGIGASGPVDRASGTVDNPETLPMFSGFPLVAGLAARLGIPVEIDNDAMVAAIAEQRVGAGRGIGRLLTVTLGTGIGAALLVDGAPFRGRGGAHPEAGHIPIVTHADPCYCGASGCWEQVASRTALQALLRPLLPGDVASRALLARAAEAEADPAVRHAFDTYGTLVGRGLSVLHTLYMPDMTVLGGSAARYIHLFRNGLERSLSRVPEFAVPVQIRATALGDGAGAIGAALMASEALGTR